MNEWLCEWLWGSHAGSTEFEKRGTLLDDHLLVLDLLLRKEAPVVHPAPCQLQVLHAPAWVELGLQNEMRGRRMEGGSVGGGG